MGNRAAASIIPTEESLKAAHIDYNNGGFQKVVQRCTAIIRSDSSCWRAKQLLGLAYLRMDKNREAIKMLQAAVEGGSLSPSIFTAMGNAYRKTGKDDIAADFYEKAIALDPEYVHAHFDQGNLFLYQGLFKKAINSYKRAIAISADHSGSYNNMGIAFQKLNQLEEAHNCFRHAVRIHPEYVNGYLNMGNCFDSQGHHERSISCYKKCIKIDPGCIEAIINLGKIYEHQNRLDDALDYFGRAVEQNQVNARALFGMGTVLLKMMRFDESKKYFYRSMRSDPNFPDAKIYYHLSLPVLYRSEIEINHMRRRFAEGLDALITDTNLDDTEQKKVALKFAGRFTNFYLQYQGQNDRVLQEKYGRFVCRIMESNFPQWSFAAEPDHFRKKNGKIRIGFVSSYMHTHSVGKFILGWVKHINKRDFSVYGYYLKTMEDRITAGYRAHIDHFYKQKNGIEDTIEKIIDDQLDILVFTDIGMYPPATLIAGLRLAPVQCATWGHPVTTGLLTIDFFLSSDLMEPEDGDDHYSEQLIRISNTGLCQDMEVLKDSCKNRKDFKIREDGFLYLSPQSLFKYLPRYDYLYPAIASQVKNAVFAFISHSSTYVTGVFKDRLATAFGFYGLKMADYCIFLPRLGKQAFLNLNLLSDVLLDTLEWSGCNSTMEGLSCGPPVPVTCPGKYMRGRHTYAILKMMGVEETIAKDENRYIKTAVRLAKDPVFYKQVRDKILKNREKIYNDKNCIRDLERFFKEAVYEKRKPLHD